MKAPLEAVDGRLLEVVKGVTMQSDHEQPNQESWMVKISNLSALPVGAAVWLVVTCFN